MQSLILNFAIVGQLAAADHKGRQAQSYGGYFELERDYFYAREAQVTYLNAALYFVGRAYIVAARQGGK